MSLIEEALQETRRPGTKCAVGRLDAELFAEVEAALDAPGVTAASIARALKRRGVDNVTQQSLRRHYTRVCQCR